MSRRADTVLPHVTRTRTLDLQQVDATCYAFTASLLDRAEGGNYESKAATEVVHDFQAVGRLERRRLRLLSLEIRALNHPYAACPQVLGVAQRLVGASLVEGWRKTVLTCLGGSRGCTHVTTLLLSLSELVTAFYFLEANRVLPYGRATRADGRWMKACLDISGTLDGACHVLTPDGEVITRAREVPK